MVLAAVALVDMGPSGKEGEAAHIGMRKKKKWKLGKRRSRRKVIDRQKNTVT